MGRIKSKATLFCTGVLILLYSLSSSAFRVPSHHKSQFLARSRNRWSNTAFRDPYFDATRHSPGTTTPPIPPSSINTIGLPLKTLDPLLYSGRWLITSSNELADELGGFLTVEIDENGFRAIAHKEGDFFTSWRVLRNGSFRLVKPVNNQPDIDSPFILPYQTSQGSATEQQQVAAAPPTPEVLGELEFDEDHILPVSVGGIGVPEGISPKKIEDLGKKRRKVRISVVDLDTMLIHFLSSGKFYVMTRSAGPTKEINQGAPLNVIVATHIVSFFASAVVEGAKHEMFDLLHLANLIK